MLHTLLLISAGATALEGVVSRLSFVWSSKRYFKVSVSSTLTLNDREVAQWQREDLDDETRVAIFQRGLLRTRLTKP